MDIDKKCKSCSSDEKLRASLIAVGIALIVSAYLFFMIRKKMKSLTSNSSVLLKIMTDYIQVVGLLTSLPSRWPSSLREIFQMQSNLNNPNTMMSSSDCTFSSLFTDINPFFQKIILAIVFSIIGPSLIVIALNINGWMHNFPRTRISYSVQTTLIILFFTFQPSYINLLFGALTCREIEGQLFLKKYIKQACWDDTHKNIVYVFVLPSLFMWMIALPSILIYLTWKKVNNRREIGAYSFMTYGYHREFFFWDFAVMLNKFCLIFLTTFIFNDELISFVLLLVSLIFLWLQVRLRPYIYEHLNYVALMSRVACHSILLCAVVGNLQGGDVAVGSIVAVVSLVSVVFISLWLHTFLRFQKAFLLKWNQYCPYKFWRFDLAKSRTMKEEFSQIRPGRLSVRGSSASSGKEKKV